MKRQIVYLNPEKVDNDSTDERYGKMRHLADEIIRGRRLGRDDDLTVFLHADLEELKKGADAIRRALCGDRADLCSIVNGRSGRCSENCKFCAQSGHHHTDCETYGFLSQQELLDDCGQMQSQGVDRFSIVTSGRTMEGEDLERSIAAYAAMHRQYPDMILCASHGLMSVKNMCRLKEAGVTVYHTNVETSPRFFPEICTTHTFSDKLIQISRVKEAGLVVCSGGIFGMGESWEDRLDMAILLAELEVGSIPLNFLIPIKGTPLADRPRLTREEIVRIVATFRYCNPEAYIRIAAGRIYFENGAQVLFQSGANAVLTGDMLTTTGSGTAQDREMLTGLGFTLKPDSSANGNRRRYYES